jgi:outer membrane protein OmpA-like peptidoglycan-associated protein
MIRTGSQFFSVICGGLLPGVLLAGLALGGCGGEQPPPNPPLPPPPPPTTTTPAVVATGDAVLEGDRIKIAKPIYYDTDKDILRPESFPVLDAVAKVIIDHPEIQLVYVEGHTDNQGNFDHNRKLSEKRANAVVTYLVAKGVTKPVQAAGYGATAPMCMTPDEACLQLNRRVEFRVKR